MTDASVCHRTGRLTDEDYAEAIMALQDAREQAADLKAGKPAPGCVICTDGDHTAESCHHNPLVLARRWAAAASIYVCWHCGYVATNDAEARAHFGSSEEEVARCIANKANSSTES